MLDSMFRSVKLCLAACLIFAATQAQAFLPESGWWWNQSESGRGFNIEIQDNMLFVATFVYDASGNAVWYTAGGKMTNDRSFSGALTAYKGGQCLGCGYQAPQGGSSPGNISITFDAQNSATVVWPAGTTKITRFAFGVDWTAPNAVLGEWAFVTGSPVYPVYYGERIKFNSTYSDAGVVYAQGNRSGQTGSAGYVLAARVTGSSTLWSALLNYSADYYLYYQFTWDGFNTIRGKEWSFKKTEDPTGYGVDFVGFRMSGKASVTGSGGPTLASASSSSPVFESLVDSLGDQDHEKFFAKRSAAAEISAALNESAVPEDMDGIRSNAAILKGLLESKKGRFE